MDIGLTSGTFLTTGISSPELQPRVGGALLLPGLSGRPFSYLGLGCETGVLSGTGVHVIPTRFIHLMMKEKNLVIQALNSDLDGRVRSGLALYSAQGKVVVNQWFTCCCFENCIFHYLVRGLLQGFRPSMPATGVKGEETQYPDMRKK